MLKVERPFPAVSASGQVNSQSFCLLTRTRALVEESRERAQTTTAVEKNMVRIDEGGVSEGCEKELNPVGR